MSLLQIVAQLDCSTERSFLECIFDMLLKFYRLIVLPLIIDRGNEGSSTDFVVRSELTVLVKNR